MAVTDPGRGDYWEQRQRQILAVLRERSAFYQRLLGMGRLLVYLDQLYRREPYGIDSVAAQRWACLRDPILTYRQTKHWQIQCALAGEYQEAGCFARRRHECEGRLLWHHLNYAHAGDWDEHRDLVRICKAHHDWVHAIGE